MSTDALNLIGEQLQALGINYEFGEWKSAIKYPYWVGTFAETPGENIEQDTTFTLDGFTRKSYLELLEQKEKIEKKYKHGMTAILGNGTGVAVLYENALCNLPTGDAELKKIQINLTIKEWSVI